MMWGHYTVNHKLYSIYPETSISNTCQKSAIDLVFICFSYISFGFVPQPCASQAFIWISLDFVFLPTSECCGSGIVCFVTSPSKPLHLPVYVPHHTITGSTPGRSKCPPAPLRRLWLRRWNGSLANWKVRASCHNVPDQET